MNWQGKNVLVAGGAGMIGSAMARELLKRGAKVTVADDLSSGSLQNIQDIQKDIEFFKYDLTNPILCFQVMRDKEAVFQFAADMGGIMLITTVGARIMFTNTAINMNMLSTARTLQTPNYFFSSTACVYPNYKQVDEKSNSINLKESDAIPADPNEFYGWEKLYAEKLVEACQRDYGMNIRVARFHNIFGSCYDDKTEILTKNGFKYFKDISYRDELATLNERSNVVEYYNPLAIQRYYYNGNMYKISNQEIDLLVTPDHNLYCRQNWRKEFKLMVATDVFTDKYLAPDNVQFRKDFPYVDNGYYELYKELETVGYSDGRNMDNRNGELKHIPIEDWLNFLGWYLSEGSCFKTPSNYVVSITQKQGRDTREKIKKAITNIGFNYYEHEKGINIHSKQLFNEMVKYGHSRDKYIPREYLQLPKDKLQILYESLMLGDGNSNGTRYNTVSLSLANGFQELALKIGKSAWIKKENDIYRININDRIYPQVCNGLLEIEYDGMVYDVTVPNHIIYIRRNGKTLWSGNCYTAFDKVKGKAPCHLIMKTIKHPNPPMELWGDGKAVRSFLYIDDCIDGVLTLMDSDYKSPINIGSDRAVTVDQLADIIIKISGKKIVPTHDLTKPQGVRGRNSCNDLCEKVLHWRPKISLEDGLERVYKWAELNYDKLENI
jgi:nucleoside-diphosphate-sugar epimerase